jgi:hypothetical protein
MRFVSGGIQSFFNSFSGGSLFLRSGGAEAVLLVIVHPIIPVITAAMINTRSALTGRDTIGCFN